MYLTVYVVPLLMWKRARHEWRVTRHQVKFPATCGRVSCYFGTTMTSRKILFGILLLYIVALAAGNRCTGGPAGSYGNFNASVSLSFTNARHLSNDVNWWDISSLYPVSPDPHYCDNNNPRLYPVGLYFFLCNLYLCSSFSRVPLFAPQMILVSRTLATAIAWMALARQAACKQIVVSAAATTLIVTIKANFDGEFSLFSGCFLVLIENIGELRRNLGISPAGIQMLKLVSLSGVR